MLLFGETQRSCYNLLKIFIELSHAPLIEQQATIYGDWNDSSIKYITGVVTELATSIIFALHSGQLWWIKW